MLFHTNIGELLRMVKHLTLAIQHKPTYKKLIVKNQNTFGRSGNTPVPTDTPYYNYLATGKHAFLPLEPPITDIDVSDSMIGSTRDELIEPPITDIEARPLAPCSLGLSHCPCSCPFPFAPCHSSHPLRTALSGSLAPWPATCGHEPATCNPLPATCRHEPATCNPLPATCGHERSRFFSTR